jgi:hypothetical protein
MRILTAVIVLLAALCLTTRSDAGQQQIDYEYCVRYSDSSGQCWGTFTGFKKDASTNAYAQFLVAAGPNSQTNFLAEYNNTFYSCIPTTGSAVANLWTAAVASRGYWRVEWNSAGTCNYIEVENGSYVGNY